MLYNVHIVARFSILSVVYIGKILCEKDSPYYYAAYLYADKHSFKRACQRELKPFQRDYSKCLGMCSQRPTTVKSGPGLKLSSRLGVILLQKSNSVLEACCHEATHAALGYSKMRKIRLNSKSVSLPGGSSRASSGEERFCKIVGSMSEQLMCSIWKTWKSQGWDKVAKP